MWRRFLAALLGAVLAYPIGAFGGGTLVYLLSTNQHDRSVEAAMTGAFVLGPAAALLGLIAGATWGGKNARPS